VYYTLTQTTIFGLAFLGWVVHSVFILPALLLTTLMFPACFFGIAIVLAVKAMKHN